LVLAAGGRGGGGGISSDDDGVRAGIEPLRDDADMIWASVKNTVDRDSLSLAGARLDAKDSKATRDDAAAAPGSDDDPGALLMSPSLVLPREYSMSRDYICFSWKISFPRQLDLLSEQNPRSDKTNLTIRADSTLSDEKR